MAKQKAYIKLDQVLGICSTYVVHKLEMLLLYV